MMTYEAITLDIHHTERITCPNCDTVQEANVGTNKNLPWLAYVHWCDSCGYLILESEWNVAECAYSGGVCNSSRCPAHMKLPEVK